MIKEKQKTAADNPSNRSRELAQVASFKGLRPSACAPGHRGSVSKGGGKKDLWSHFVSPLLFQGSLGTLLLHDCFCAFEKGEMSVFRNRKAMRSSDNTMKIALQRRVNSCSLSGVVAGSKLRLPSI